MAEYKINQALWDALSEDQQVHIDSMLREVEILEFSDLIVPDPDTSPAEFDREDFPPHWGAPDDCVDACDAAIDIMITNCIATGGNPVLCGLAAQTMFRKCCEACADGFD